METLYFLLHRNGPPPSIHESSLRNGFCSSSPRVLCRRGVSGELRDPVPQVFSQKQGPKNRLLNGSVEVHLTVNLYTNIKLLFWGSHMVKRFKFRVFGFT